LFQATPLAQSRNARFVWTQLIKRSPIDVRGAIAVPAERNAKGIALFALAQLANYRRVKTEESRRQAMEGAHAIDEAARHRSVIDDIERQSRTP